MTNQTSKELCAEFGHRLCRLADGQVGLRTLLTCEVRASYGDEPKLDFVASNETLDHYQEVIKADGWDLSVYTRNPVVLDTHHSGSIERILGRSTQVGVRDGQLVNTVHFALENPLGALAYKLAKGGFLRAQSVGFIPKEWVNGKGNDGPRRTYTKSLLTEISLVPVPANPSATMALEPDDDLIEAAAERAAALITNFRTPAAPGSNSPATQAPALVAAAMQRDLAEIAALLRVVREGLTAK